MMARRVACGDPFKLVLLDAQMPAMDGFAVATSIKCIPESAETIIMMLSSSDQHNDASRCRESGIETYLVKPVKQSDLLNSIIATLSSHSETPLKQSNPNPPNRPNQLSGQAKLHILVAEDNAVNQTLIKRLLEKRGYSAVLAENGKQALAALQSGDRFDAVLMDVQMPEMNGFEATKAIRLKEHETGDHIPIIALTAHALKGDDERCLQAGMDGYLSKPIQSEELFNTIERLASGTVIVKQNIDRTIESRV
jgi:two-component system sensor histidine kinase/response regulator